MNIIKGTKIVILLKDYMGPLTQKYNCIYLEFLKDYFYNLDIFDIALATHAPLDVWFLLKIKSSIFFQNVRGLLYVENKSTHINIMPKHGIHDHAFYD